MTLSRNCLSQLIILLPLINYNKGQQDIINQNYKTPSHNNYGLWKDARVPFYIGDKYDVPAFKDSERKMITTIMEQLEKRTCLKFVPWNGKEDRLVVQRGYRKDKPWTKESNDRCRSTVGWSGNETILTLSPSCMNERTIRHELGHSLGLWHEQSRVDRDDYVTVIWQNIKPGKEGNFQRTYMKEAIKNLPYDYASVMHYKKSEMAKNGKVTIVTKNEAWNELIGESSKYSRLDILKINLLYGCCQQEQYGCKDITEHDIKEMMKMDEKDKFDEADARNASSGRITPSSGLSAALITVTILKLFISTSCHT